MSIPYNLQEETKNLFRCFGERNNVQIICKEAVECIVDAGTCKWFSLTIDGNETASTDDLVVAIEVAFALHYIFNLVYPKELNGFYTFIQKDILQLPDTSVPISKVLKLIRKLNFD